jgi:ElaB/YqjD/DUF883 family membrane-anchored ribosome-binding protein
MVSEREFEEFKTNVQESLKSLAKEFDARFTSLRQQMPDLRLEAGRSLSERPLLSLGIAFVLGMSIGIALCRSRR